MRLRNKNALVVGASGVLGGKLARELHEAGMNTYLAGRDREALAAVSSELGGAGHSTFEAIDTDSCRRVVETAADSLAGLDLVLVATGVAAFGPTANAEDAVTEHLLTVNTLAPVVFGRAALPHLEQRGGTLAVLSAILADHPTAGMADYSASKAALSAWLTATRREVRRRGVDVFDIRPPHVDSGLAERALSGTPPRTPPATDTDEVVETIVSGIRDSAHELHYDLDEQQLRLVF
ncbi:Short-chain dehydrogenase [Actinopolyspora xinjiangensis]|uniref:Short-chain dehydrogenase n=1 Tax=Actinopolyspora xinjiangensis TaxID=405564 RepID=A0A1H0RM21_9ACTN|nr:SDR family oxidoreductase [Actinopolyspora xinjiangensis]SDP30561.1 Short-chain dehydrogenase [Actinopolyspora xinjiangensis]